MDPLEGETPINLVPRNKRPKRGVSDVEDFSNKGCSRRLLKQLTKLVT